MADHEHHLTAQIEKAAQEVSPLDQALTTLNDSVTRMTNTVDQAFRTFEAVLRPDDTVTADGISEPTPRYSPVVTAIRAEAARLDMNIHRLQELIARADV